MRGGQIQGPHDGGKGWRHHQPGYAVHGRSVVRGAIVEIDEATGGVRVEGNDLVQNEGDLQSLFRFRTADTSLRPHAAFSPAFSSIVSAPPAPPKGGGPKPGQTQTRGAGGVGGASGGGGTVLPLRRSAETDTRFEAIPLQLGNPPPSFRGLPAGVSGHVSAAMEEFSLHGLFHPDWLNYLIAVNKAGDPNLSTAVFDLTARNELDPIRWARLHDFLTVLDLTPGAPGAGLLGRTLAWAIGRAGNLDGGPGYGLMVDHDLAQYHLIASSHGGPLTGGVACQHGGQLGTDADGRRGFPAHVDVNALRIGHGGDGPQLFEASKWVEPDGDYGLEQFVHHRWNPIGFHKLGRFVSGRGFWQWEVKIPSRIIPPPWIPWDPPPMRDPPREPPRRELTGGGGVSVPGEGDDEEIAVPGATGTNGRPITGNTGRAFTGAGSLLARPRGYDFGLDGIPPADDPIFRLPGIPVVEEEAAELLPRPGRGEREAATGSLLPGQTGGELDGPNEVDGRPPPEHSLLDDADWLILPRDVEEDAESTEPQPGSVNGEAPTNAHASVMIPVCDFSTTCRFSPDVGLIATPTDPSEIAIAGTNPQLVQKQLAKLPLVSTRSGLAIGNGTIAGTPKTVMPNGQLAASGWSVSRAISVSLPDLARGLYDPCRHNRTAAHTTGDLHPGGVSRVAFAHPNPASPTGVSGGGYLEQGPGCPGGVVVATYSSTGDDEGPTLHVQHEHVTVLGDLTVTGALVGGVDDTYLTQAIYTGHSAT